MDIWPPSCCPSPLPRPSPSLTPQPAAFTQPFSTLVSTAFLFCFSIHRHRYRHFYPLPKHTHTHIEAPDEPRGFGQRNPFLFTPNLRCLNRLVLQVWTSSSCLYQLMWIKEFVAFAFPPLLLLFCPAFCPAFLLFVYSEVHVSFRTPCVLKACWALCSLSSDGCLISLCLSLYLSISFLSNNLDPWASRLGTEGPFGRCSYNLSVWILKFGHLWLSLLHTASPCPVHNLQFIRHPGGHCSPGDGVCGLICHQRP